MDAFLVIFVLLITGGVGYLVYLKSKSDKKNELDYYAIVSSFSNLKKDILDSFEEKQKITEQQFHLLVDGVQKLFDQYKTLEHEKDGRKEVQNFVDGMKPALQKFHDLKESQISTVVDIIDSFNESLYKNTLSLDDREKLMERLTELKVDVSSLSERLEDEFEDLNDLTLSVLD